MSAWRRLPRPNLQAFANVSKSPFNARNAPSRRRCLFILPRAGRFTAELASLPAAKVTLAQRPLDSNKSGPEDCGSFYA